MKFICEFRENFIKYRDNLNCKIESSQKAVRNYQDLRTQRNKYFTFRYEYMKTVNYILRLIFFSFFSTIETTSSSSKIPLFSLILNYESHSSKTRSSSSTSNLDSMLRFFEETQGEIYINEASDDSC